MMLDWIRGDGIENIFSLDVFSLYGATINAELTSSDTTQYLPDSNMFISEPSHFYMNIVSQLTGKVNFIIIGTKENIRPTRSQQFSIFIDEHHLDLDNGQYNYEVFWGSKFATSISHTDILAKLTTGIILVHDQNWLNKEFTNSESGMKESVIPPTKAYNG